jgi:hypothetical protein
MSGTLKTVGWLWLIAGIATACLMFLDQIGRVSIGLNSGWMLAAPWTTVADWSGLTSNYPLPVFLVGVFLNSWLFLSLGNMVRK